MSSFGKAFSAARKAGKKTFTFNGKSYTTKTKEEATPPVPVAKPDKFKTKGSTVGGNAGNKLKPVSGLSVPKTPFTTGGNAGAKSTVGFTKGGNSGNKSTTPFTKGGNTGNKSRVAVTKGGNSGNKIAPSESMSALGIKLNVKKKPKAKLHQ